MLRDSVGRRESIAMSPTFEASFNIDEEHYSSALGGGEWFPTLQKTMTLLAKLHSSLPVRTPKFT